MVLYLIFVFSLTGYLLATPPPYYYKQNNGTLVWYANGEDKYGSIDGAYVRSTVSWVFKWSAYVLGGLGVLKEIVQICTKRRDYLSFENIMEWFIYTSSCLFVFDFNSEQRASGLRYQWQWSFGAFAIFFAWMEVVIFMRKVAYIGTFVVMFTDMLKTFGRFSIILFLFLLAFSLSFYSLLMNQSTFSSFGYALMKTFVMLTGEFDYDEIFHSIGYLDKDMDMESNDYFEQMVWYETVTYVIFAIFIVIAAILIMNLLIGLAVDDIKVVQEKAELKKSALQIEFVLDVEQMMPRIVKEKYFNRSTATIFPNSYKQRKSTLSRLLPDIIGMKSSISIQAIAKSLNPEQDMRAQFEKGTDLDELQRHIDKQITPLEEISKRLGENDKKIDAVFQGLSNRIEEQGKRMEEQNNRIEAMLRDLLPNESDL
ncbi:transient receptor potential cation channel subfamily A member 1 homolog [Ptychodera flava]|uniref:transient receptor potential cation channel subfamily A member 1 homolog n=1 Tax=Ptychodera flava TaxID=63121 RepID=UPI00396A0829